MLTKTSSQEPQGDVQWLPVSSLGILWANTQREFDPRRVKRFASAFDLNALGALIVSSRVINGMRHIIDGQHRARAAIMARGPDQLVPCRIVECDDAARAAHLFIVCNTTQRKPHRYDLYRAALTGGDPAITEIDRIIRGVGYRVSSTKSPGALVAFDALQRIHARHGPSVLERTLRLTKAFWGLDKLAPESWILRGVALFVVEFQFAFDEPRLVYRTQKECGNNYLTLLGTAKGKDRIDRIGMDEAVKEVLLTWYNLGLRDGSGKRLSRNDSPRKEALNGTQASAAA